MVKEVLKWHQSHSREKGRSFFFKQTMLEKLDSHMQKNRLDPYIFYNSKWIKDSHARSKNNKLFEENITQKLHDIRWDDFLDVITKAKVRKIKYRQI